MTCPTSRLSCSRTRVRGPRMNLAICLCGGPEFAGTGGAPNANRRSPYCSSMGHRGRAVAGRRGQMRATPFLYALKYNNSKSVVRLAPPSEGRGVWDRCRAC